VPPGSQDSVVTEHRVAAPPPHSDVLCGTAFVGEYSFTLQLAPSCVIELGRGADADIQLVSGGVSRAHARLTVNGENGIVEDLGSRNGTFVNRTRATGATPVGHGDEIGIGDARFVLYRRSSLPEGVVPALVRRALLARIDVDIAAGARPCLFVVQLPERWYEIRAARELIGKLASVGYAGLYNDQILAFAVHASRGEALTIHASTTRGLRLAGVDAASGFASEASGDALELLNAALKALLSAQEDDAETTEQPIVTDARMLRLFDEARRIASSAASVLLVGETGVGKEVFARTIHVASGRKGPLVCVNTAALPEQLLESELFGHEKGAFSGATTAKVGLVETAHGGTLFLDEIGEMPMGLQAKLLRILEDRGVRRVGATTERKIDVRVVAATNCDLDEAVREKRFRRDLLFRLNACTLQIPPLRERKGEILRLAEVFLTRAAAAMSAPHLRLGAAAQELLNRHSWPGNVRELRNVIDRAAALCAPSGEPIGPEHLPDALRGTPAPAAAPAAAPGNEMIRDTMRDFERQRILDALDRTGGNQTQAAELLGLPRRTLAYKMARLGIRTK
jgi:two-component system, NtrC family, response regulator AtoC